MLTLLEFQRDHSLWAKGNNVCYLPNHAADSCINPLFCFSFGTPLWTSNLAAMDSNRSLIYVGELVRSSWQWVCTSTQLWCVVLQSQFFQYEAFRDYQLCNRTGFWSVSQCPRAFFFVCLTSHVLVFRPPVPIPTMPVPFFGSQAWAHDPCQHKDVIRLMTVTSGKWPWLQFLMPFSKLAGLVHVLNILTTS